MNTHEKIPAFAINLKSRVDRLKSIHSEFLNHEGFKLEIVEAIEHVNGAIGLWKTIYSIINEAYKRGDKFVLICEDDHVFTRHFDMEDCINRIRECQSIGIDVLLGGVSWFEGAIRSTDNLYWVDSFNGTQFMIVFREFFQKFLAMPIEDCLSVDMAISYATNHLMVIYPFISIQREFGYSDVTDFNNKAGYVEAIFEASKNKFDVLDKVYQVLFTSKHAKLT